MISSDQLHQFKGVRHSGDGWIALCPAHDDSRPSLHISKGDNGLLILYCFAGCSYEAILAATGIREAGNGCKRRIVAEYDYRDEQDVLLYQAIRYDPKGFSQRRPDGTGGWIYKLDGVRRVLYRLPELLAADPSKPVFIVEGEKDVDRLHSLGLVATTNAGGAGKWRGEFSEFLRGRTVVIFPDNDEPGRKHVKQIAKSLRGVATGVKVIDLPNVPEKGDISDWLGRGGTIEQLHTLAESTQDIDTAAAPPHPHAAPEGDYNAGRAVEWPTLHGAALHGLAGDFVRVVLPHSEADQVALLASFLITFGNIIGRNSYFTVEDRRHYLNLFGVLVGATGAGRKGTAQGRVERVFAGLDGHWEKECVIGGLSSGEGLLYQVRDADGRRKRARDGGANQPEQEAADEGVIDKRLLCVESEFAGVLRMQSRDGNTLSSYLRNLWDTGDVRSLVKNSPIRTTDAHVSILGHITREELRVCLTEVETANGYVNRFLWLCVRRGKYLPRGGNLTNHELNPVKIALRRAIECGQESGEMILDDSAWLLWDIVYTRLETGRTGLFGKATQRAAPIVRRLACLYALLELSRTVRREHLQAALALWRYAEDSARYLFGTHTGDRLADRLLSALQEAKGEGLTRTQLRDVCGRNESSARITGALQNLNEMGTVRCERVAEGDNCKPTERWFVSTPKTLIPDDIYDITSAGSRVTDGEDRNVVNVVRQESPDGIAEIASSWN